MKDAATPTNAKRMKTIMYLKVVIVFVTWLLLGITQSNAQVITSTGVLGDVDFESVVLDPTETGAARFQITENGDFQMIGNNTVGRRDNTGGPNGNYNAGGNNNNVNFGYIDVDGDTSTFQSSTAEFTIGLPCTKILYAGLYWTATYYNTKFPDPFPFNTRFRNVQITHPDTPVQNALKGITGIPQLDNRHSIDGLPGTFRDIKFKPPGATDYIDIHAGGTLQGDGSFNDTTTPLSYSTPQGSYTSQIIFDGWRNTPTNSTDFGAKDVPYVCYADVTNILQALPDAQGTYTAGNIRATTDIAGHGSSGGWILVVIYDDPSLSRKHFSTRRGFKQVSGKESNNDPGAIREFLYENFITLPPPVSVINSRFGIVSLEGDRGIRNDGLQILSQPSNAWTPLSQGVNLVDNFFNSTISNSGANNLARNPASQNTLGLDVDVIDITSILNDGTPFPTNPITSNDYMENNQTEVRFRAITNGDGYSVLINTFAVEILEPTLRVIKTALDSAFDPIADGDEVSQGSTLFYNLNITNESNENIIDATMIDNIPDNVDFIGFTIIPTGVTASYDAVTRRISITLDDAILKENDPSFDIRFEVRVVDDCARLTNACSNIIENIAESTYLGEISRVPKTNDPSIPSFDPCNSDAVRTTNTFLDFDDFIAACNLVTREAFVCTEDVPLEAGGGFDTYEWRNAATGAIVGTTQTIIVSPTDFPAGVTTLNYVVDKRDDDCPDLQETWTITALANIQNPIVAIATGLVDRGRVLVCGDNGDQPYPQLFLCGAGDTIPLDLGLQLGNATTVQWERLDFEGCPSIDVTDNCPTQYTLCGPQWTVVEPNNTSYTLDESGEYRIRATFSPTSTINCSVTFRFEVFADPVNPNLAVVEPILCARTGILEVQNLAVNDFEYRLETPSGAFIPSATTFQNSHIFNGLTEDGQYTLSYVRRDGLAAFCNVPITATLQELDADVAVTITNPSCPVEPGKDVQPNQTGEILVTVTSSETQYEYTIFNEDPADPFTDSTGLIDSASHTFTGINEGTYTIEVESADGVCMETITGQQVVPENTIVPTIVLIEDLQCNPNYQPDTSLCVDENDPGYIACDFDPYIARFTLEIAFTSTAIPPVIPSYTYSYNRTDNLTGLVVETGVVISPEDAVASPLVFRLTDPGLYEIFVSESNSTCGVSRFLQRVNDFTPLAADAPIATSPDCPSDLGSIQVNVTAGEGPFTYVLDEGLPTEQSIVGAAGQVTSGSATFTNLPGVAAPGRTYTVSVRDRFYVANPAAACVLSLADQTIITPLPITATVGVTQLQCNLSGTTTPPAGGQITFSGPANGNGSYRYSIDGGASFQNSPIFNNLIAGTYTPTIADTDTETSCPTELLPVLEIDALNPPTDITYTLGASSCSAQTVLVTPQAVPVGPTYTYTAVPVDGSNPTPTPDGSGAFTLLRGEIYTFTAVNTTNVCRYSETHTEAILPEIQITTAIETDAVSCIGGSDGEFSFTVTNSTAFDYTITGGPTAVPSGSATGTAPITVNITSGVEDGIYTINVTDTSKAPASNNCTDSETVPITEPTTAIAFTIDPVQQDCSTGNTVTISGVSGSNGGPFTYVLNDATATPIGPARAINLPYENVPGGTGYQIIVSDVSGCPSTPQNVPDITPLPVVTPSITSSELCLDDAIATLDIAIAGGTADFSYDITRDGIPVVGLTALGAGVTSFTTPNLTQSGTYIVTITDSAGCTGQVTQVIAPPVSISASLGKILDCSASPAAQIDIVVSGGNGATSLALSTNSGAFLAYTGSLPFTTTTAGTYQFKVTDAATCFSDSAVITVSPAPNPVVNAPSITNPTCNGDMDGAVVINIDTSVGTGPYQVDFNGLGFSTQTTYGGLAEGTYNYTVMDAKGCTVTPSVMLTAPPVVIDNIAFDDIQCDGSGTVTPGEIRFNGITGGVPPYTATLLNSADLSNATTSSTNPMLGVASGANIAFSNLNFGDYTLRIVDSNGCAFDFLRSISTQPIFTITSSAPPVGTCAGGVTATINITGGAPPYMIREYTPAGTEPYVALSPGPNTHVFNNLPFDTPFLFEVIDNNGCTDIQTLTPPASPSTLNIALVETPVACVGDDDGSIGYTITGYQGTELTYSIFRSNDLVNPITGGVTFSAGNPQTVVAASTALGSVTDFGPGTYVIRVEETGGVPDPCNASMEFTITESATPLAYNTTTITAGYCTASSQGIVSVSGGTGPYGFLVVEDGDPNPGTYAANNVVVLDQTVNLDWDLYITDANDCILGPIDLTASVIADPVFTGVPVAFVDDPCNYDNNYTFTVTATGTGNLEYGIDDGDTGTADVPSYTSGAGTFTFTVSGAGEYNYFVRDANGCTDTRVITIYDPLSVSAEFATPPTCTAADGVIRATVTGTVAGNLTFELLDAAGLGVIIPGVVGTSPFLFTPPPGIAPNSYTVRVTDDGRSAAPGCSFTIPVAITAPIEPVIAAQVAPLPAVSCVRASDGAFTIALTAASMDPNATYAYEITGSTTVNTAASITRPSQVSPTFSGLPAETYDILVTATVTNGIAPSTQDVVCTTTGTYTIDDITPVTATASLGDPFGCNAANDVNNATINVFIDGTTGTGPDYFVTVTRPAPDNTVIERIPVSTTTAINLLVPDLVIQAPIGGDYEIEIFDSNNCPLVNTPLPAPPAAPVVQVLTVNVPPLPVMTAPTVTQFTTIDCVNGQEVVDVHITGGSTVGNFTFTEILSGVIPAITPQTIVAGTGDGVGVGTAAGVQTVARFNLPAVGNYQFEIEDVTTGCTIRTTPIYEVGQFNNIQVAITSDTDITCFDTTPPDGSITFAISGHTGTFDYSVTNLTTTTVVATGSGTGVTPIVVNNLAAGNIQVAATVTVGATVSTVCIAISNVVNIAPAPVIMITMPEQVNPESCVPGDDASIQATATGGTGTLEYKIERITDVDGTPLGVPVVVVDYGANTNTNPGLFTGLDAGTTPAGITYEVFARDADMCDVSETITIVPPVDLTLMPAFPTTPAILLQCSDSVDGEIRVTAGGGQGSGSYFFQLTFPNGSQSTPVAANGVTEIPGGTNAQHLYSNLPPSETADGPVGTGEYVVTVTDNIAGCSESTNFIIRAPDPVEVTVNPNTTVSCLSNNPSSIQLSGSGGTVLGTYTYFYVNAAGVEVPPDVAPDTYISEDVVGGTLEAGESYQFFARDDNDCVSIASNTITIVAPEPLVGTLNENNTSLLCFGDASASINLETLTGGVGGFMYSVIGTDYLGNPVNLGPQTDTFFSGLSATNTIGGVPGIPYIYRITSGDCTPRDLPFFVTQPEELMVPPPVAEDISCAGEVDGRITVTVSGGSLPDPGISRYFFSLYDSSDNLIGPPFIEDEVDNVLGSHTFEGLAAGTYRVIVQDKGCSVVHDDIVIIEPALLEANTLATTPEECAGDSNGTATLSLTGGTQPTALAPLPVPPPEYYVSVTGEAGSYQLVADPTNHVITGLPGGTNTIFIRDARNSSDCELLYNVDIVPGVSIAAILEDRKECPIVDDTGAVIEPTSYFIDFRLTTNIDLSRADELVGPNDIVYTLTGINGTADPINNTSLTGTFEVVPGEYLGTMLHARGCEVSAGTIVVDQYVPLSLPVAVMTGNVADPNEYEITITGGVAPYTYYANLEGTFNINPDAITLVEIEPGVFTVSDINTNELFPSLEDSKFVVRETGNYDIRVIDATGCEVTTSQFITYINIRIPNYFRPNDPNSSLEEQFWYPRQITPNTDDPFFFENMEVKVFDRYGRLLEEFTGDQQGWDGLYQGKQLPSGDYWFTIILNDAENKEFTGHFTLYR